MEYLIKGSKTSILKNEFNSFLFLNLYLECFFCMHIQCVFIKEKKYFSDYKYCLLYNVTVPI